MHLPEPKSTINMESNRPAVDEAVGDQQSDNNFDTARLPLSPSPRYASSGAINVLDRPERSSETFEQETAALHTTTAASSNTGREVVQTFLEQSRVGTSLEIQGELLRTAPEALSFHISAVDDYSFNMANQPIGSFVCYQILLFQQN